MDVRPLSQLKPAKHRSQSVKKKVDFKLDVTIIDDDELDNKVRLMPKPPLPPKSNHSILVKPKQLTLKKQSKLVRVGSFNA